MSRRVSDYDFHLPPELIAQRPSAKRGESRLMQVSATGELSFGVFSDLLSTFKGDEVLVLNDAKVVPARLYGVKESGGQVEVFFLEPAPSPTPPPHQALELNHEAVYLRAFTRGRLKPGQRLSLPLGVSGVMVERDAEGVALLALEGLEPSAPSDPHGALWAWLEQAGQTPLPPYIKRAPDDDDRERYQTVYAKTPGAVAAPTAGLHFTPELLQALQDKGVEVHTLSLIVGPGTFAPVKAERIEDHHMHTERYHVPERTAQAVRSGRPVVAVGTTVVRALESWAHDPSASETSIFITPGYPFQLIDGLITTFHLPQSTLLMLVSAFAGYEVALKSYERAVEEGMRFYSYGDASVFRRPDGRWAR